MPISPAGRSFTTVGVLATLAKIAATKKPILLYRRILPVLTQNNKIISMDNLVMGAVAEDRNDFISCPAGDSP